MLKVDMRVVDQTFRNINEAWEYAVNLLMQGHAYRIVIKEIVTLERR